MSNNPEIRATRDGSSTLYSPHFEQHYHNPNGAWSESLHVFFEKTGLIRKLKDDVSLQILETGFGTGLNLILLADLYKSNKCTSKIIFHSVEAFPITFEKARDLEFSGQMKDPELAEALPVIFGSLSEGENSFFPFEGLNIELRLFIGRFEDWDLDKDSGMIHYFFHDPFSPDANPELWEKDVFRKFLHVGVPDAILTTYCAASSARASMAAAGWLVARTRGALGKREMTLASPDPAKLSDYKRVNESRLIQRLEAGDFSL